MGTNMETLVFITYAIAASALVAAVWAIIEVAELRKTFIRKQIQNRLRQVVQETKSKQKKSLWD